MSQFKLKDGTRAKIKIGTTTIGYITSFTADANYNIVDANELGNMFPVEQHVMSYKATVNVEFFVDDLTHHRLTELSADGMAVLQTAMKYNFPDKETFGNFLKFNGNRFNIEIYSIDNAADLVAFVDNTSIVEKLLFKIDNLLIQSESIRIQQGQMITATASFVSTDPILNHTALAAI